MKVIGFGETLWVAASAGDALPAEFTWRGRRHRVRRIERFRMETYPSRNGLVRRRFFRLRTASGMRCLVSQDVDRDTWRMEKVVTSRGGAQ